MGRGRTKGTAMETVDLGCGDRKSEGSFGVDMHPYPGVDLVADLNKSPWPIEGDRFDRVVARHIIEHVEDVGLFMNEIHRICRHGAVVEITTPHFSSIYSWGDPTHRRHLATIWYKVCTEGYLSEQMARFEFVSTRLRFHGNVRLLIGKLIAWLCGVEWWEKHYAFVYPARQFRTTLRVMKGK